MTLRDEINGKKKPGGGSEGGGSSNLQSVLRMQHLQNLSLWAGGEASMPSVAAFFGNRLATCGEASGIPIDSSLFPCQRCESILQPGYNCTVRIETNGAKVRRKRKKLIIPTQNIVIYTCHFCSHRNVKKGTPKGHMKDIFASKQKPVSELNASFSTDQKSVSCKRVVESSKEIDKKMEGISSLKPASQSKPESSETHTTLVKEISVENNPTTPKERSKMVLSEGRRRKSGSALKKHVGNENRTVKADAENVVGESSRKRRKTWSSLKEIAENSERENNRNLTNLTLPFLL